MRPGTLWPDFLRSDHWAVCSAFRFAFTDEVPFSTFCIFRRNLQLVTCILWYEPLYACAVWHFKNRSFLVPSFRLAVSCLKTQSWKNSGFLPADWMNLWIPDSRFKLRLLWCAFPKVGLKWFPIQLRKVPRFHIFRAAFYLSPGTYKDKSKCKLNANFFDVLYPLNIDRSY